MLIYIKLILTAMFWGGTFIAGRIVSEQENIPAFSIAFWRFAMASVLLIALVFKIEKTLPPVTRRDLLPLALLGLTGILIYNVCFFRGLKVIQAGRASLIIATCPIFIYIFTWLFFRDKSSSSPAFTRSRVMQIAGILISVIGAMVVISRGDLNEIIHGGLGRGELYIFGCVMCWVAYSLIGKKVMGTYSPLVTVTYSCIVGTVGLLLPACLEGMVTQVGSYSLISWLSIAYLGVFGTVIGFVWFYQGVKTIGPVKTALFINFIPIFAILEGYLILHEEVSISLAAGGLLVIAGVYLTNLKTA